ncbi:MAG: LacI family DNA-binding transcriptional regulator [Bacteroidota bacterium]
MRLNKNTISALKAMRIELVKELAKDLPSGFKTEIAKRAGVSKATVTKFLNGKDNRKLYSVLVQYANEYIQETKESVKMLGIEITE